MRFREAQQCSSLRCRAIAHARARCRSFLQSPYARSCDTEFRLPGAHFKALLADARMNIHEYQAKEVLEKFGVATPRGKVASTPEEAEQIARELGDVAEPGEAGQLLQGKKRAGPNKADGRSWATQPIDPIGCPPGAKRVDLVVKAQIHAGGR